MNTVYYNKTVIRRRISFDALKNKTESDLSVNSFYRQKAKSFLMADKTLISTTGSIQVEPETDIVATDQIIIDGKTSRIVSIMVEEGSITKTKEVFLQ